MSESLDELFEGVDVIRDGLAVLARDVETRSSADFRVWFVICPGTRAAEMADEDAWERADTQPHLR